MKFLIAIVFFSISTIFFLAEQDPDVHNRTLAWISSNYERTNNGNGEIVEGEQPYQQITPDNLYNWDAVLYKTMRDHMYDPTCHGHQVLQAFYPLFSIVWKITQIDSSLIIIFNYVLFIIGIVLLSNLLKEKKIDHFHSSIALLLPTTVMFCLPYAEALFLLTFAIAVVGLFQKRYWLFFLGAFAFSMTRPACLIYLFVLIAVDIRYFIIHKNFKYFIKELSLKILPFTLGFLTVTIIQHYYTGSWTAYWDSLAYWPPPKGGISNPILDWSVEGFGMDAVAICFVALPAFVYSIVWGIKTFKQTIAIPVSLFSGDKTWIKEYLFNSSILFIAGNLVYTFLTTGNVINGFARYTMAVPFFYMVWFQLHEKFQGISLRSKLIGVASCVVALILFVYFVEYGGDRFRFAYTGMYLSIAVILFYIAAPHFSFKTNLIIFLILLLPAIVWHTYLFNMYLCQAWIYM